MSVRAQFAALATALLLLAAVPASAATKVQQVTSPGGITAWLVEDHSLPVVTLVASFRGGAALDPAGKAGLASLTSDLLDEGAGTLDSQAFQGKLEDLASSLDFDAGADDMDASLRTVSANLAPSLALLHLALTVPRFDEGAVARVRSQLLAQLAEERTEPRYLSGRLWFENAYGDHPYARPEEGTPESVGRIAIADMRALVKRRFAKDNLIIGVVGDVTSEALKRELDLTFGDLPAHAALGKVPEMTVSAKAPLLLARMAIPQSVVTFGQPGIKRDDPDWYAAYIVNHILGGGGFSSRLTQEVRVKRGLAYSVYSTLVPLRHSGLILGGVATRNSRVAESIDIIRAQWQRMHDDGPTAEELENAKTYLTGSFVLGLDSTARIAGMLVAIQRDKLGIDYLDRRNTLIDKVTLADTKRVARRLLDPAKLSFVVVGSPEKLPGAKEIVLHGVAASQAGELRREPSVRQPPTGAGGGTVR
ncbi:MAG TPA: pitrilysin family protein [Stellaceae bacterium]|nr:pitrilysin family protein [Stellaceae bacterium]